MGGSKRTVKGLDAEFRRIFSEAVGSHQCDRTESTDIGIMKSSSIVEIETQRGVAELGPAQFAVVDQQRTREARLHHEAITGFRDKFYTFGGGVKISPTSDNWYPSNRVWEYTPATDSWRELAPMPTKRGGGIALVLDNKIWVIGGAGFHPLQAEDISIAAGVPHRTVNTVEVFDPATGKWETKASMLVPRNHLAGGVVNGKIYVMGGRMGSSFVGASSTDAVEEYDPSTDMWRVVARMPYPRSGMAFGTAGNLIYMAGGEFLNRDMVGVFRNAEAFDPARHVWYELPPMTVARHGFAGGIINGVFHTVTGQLQSGTGGGGPGGSPAHEGYLIGKPAPAATASK